ncbi:MAG: DNA repair protein RadC [Peptococcaceae bacterium]|jgi:DNA repair protein RadC|nr:DNA repair protein RadC [Peptococcaceae bacterium]
MRKERAAMREGAGNTNAMGVKSMPSFQRPRERLLTYGAGQLTDQELLAILIGSGSKEESALVLAQRMLQKNDGRFILEAEAGELSEIKGIGEAKACRIKAAMELSRRLLFVTQQHKPVIHGPKDAADILQSEIGFLDREAVRVINVNSANQVIAVDSVSLGGLAAAPIHPREVFKAPLKRSAAGIIILHNHPSGDLKPSLQDLEETLRMSAAGELLGIKVYDHIILSYGKYYSLLEAGKMPEDGKYTTVAELNSKT